jgi:hypothetical protein
MKSGMRTAIYAFALMALAACSSGGDGGGGTTPVASAPPLTGTLLDAPVVGMPYVTSSGLSGVTDAQGQFRYRAGDTITFSYGQTTIGPIPTAPQITPWTAFGLNTPDPAKPAWVNLARFLQTFNNQLPSVTPAIAGLLPVIFDQADAAFSTDLNLSNLLTAMGSNPAALVSAAQARQTLGQQFSHLGSWFAQNIFGPNFVVFTAMADGTFVISEDGSSDPTGRDGMERGIYTWNPATGAFTATVQVDTNGQNGISHATPPFTAIINPANTLTFTPGGGDPPVVLTRVIDNAVPANPAVGAWRFDNTDGPGTMAVVTLFANGTFVLVSDETAPINDGMERGMYSASDPNGNVTFTRLVDTNADAGIFDPAGPAQEVLNIAINGDTMTVTEPGNPTQFIGARIRPPQ